MNITRVVVLGVGGGALAAWLASAATTSARPITLAPQPKAAAMEKSGAELASEIARLHDRLHPTSSPVDPSRNLFTFGASRAAHVAAPAVAPAAEAAPAPPVPVAPAIALLGIAEDGGVRTAILSVDDKVLLVKEGDHAGDAYTVLHIDPTAVELAGASSDSRSTRLALK
ncbi:MAG TPA: hypothetical protein VHZ73_07660 [Vicinamibacterales bacterium]|jgi:hypothetical protein|nr:hypothetical protein [Vicinamibacterales bacterium]